jgi:hypothetical protein
VCPRASEHRTERGLTGVVYPGCFSILSSGAGTMFSPLFLEKIKRYENEFQIRRSRNS